MVPALGFMVPAVATLNKNPELSPVHTQCTHIDTTMKQFRAFLYGTQLSYTYHIVMNGTLRKILSYLPHCDEWHFEKDIKLLTTL